MVAGLNTKTFLQSGLLLKSKGNCMKAKVHFNVYGKKFQNITSYYNSQNAQEVHAIFCLSHSK